MLRFAAPTLTDSGYRTKHYTLCMCLYANTLQLPRISTTKEDLGHSFDLKPFHPDNVSHLGV